MLDTFAVHGARPRCNPSPPKRQHLGMPAPELVLPWRHMEITMNVSNNVGLTVD